MAIAETIVVRLESDTRTFTNGMANSVQTTQRFSKATNTLKQGLVGLALQATGTAGPLGKLSQALLLFAGGSALVLGVAAGIGAIALVYRDLTRDTRQAEQAQKDLIQQLQSVGIHAQLTAARIELGKLQAERDKGSFGTALGGIAREGPISGAQNALAARREEFNRRIATQLNIIARLTQESSKWQQEWTDAVIEGNLAWENFVAKLQAAELRTLRLAVAQQGLKRLDRVQLRGVPGPQGQGAEVAPGFDPTAELDRLQRDFDSLTRGEWAANLNESLRQLGESAGKQFALALIDGIQSMQDLMKSVLLQFLSIGLDAVFGGFGRALGLSPSVGGGGGDVPGQSSAPIGPASFSLNVAGGLSAPTTIFAMQRDAEWQRVLRGSLLVARSDGFR